MSELLDLRKMLEPPLAARAATHASAADVAEMEDILQRQEEKQGQGDAAIAEDNEFHYSHRAGFGQQCRAESAGHSHGPAARNAGTFLASGGASAKVPCRPSADSGRHQAPRCGSGGIAMRRHIEDVEEIVLNKF